MFSALCPEPKLSQTLEQREPLGCRLGYISQLSLHYQVHLTRAQGLICVQFVLALSHLILFHLAPDLPVGLQLLTFLKLLLLIKAEVRKALIQHLTFFLCPVSPGPPTHSASGPHFP